MTTEDNFKNPKSPIRVLEIERYSRIFSIMILNFATRRSLKTFAKRKNLTNLSILAPV